MISRAIALFTAFTVFMWLMPLGVLIKPGQEKVVCGGKRAVHQCPLSQARNLAQNNTDKRFGVQLAAVPGSVNKQAPSSGGGNDYVFPNTKQPSHLQRFWSQQPSFLSHQLLFISAIDHVPKT